MRSNVANHIPGLRVFLLVATALVSSAGFTQTLFQEVPASESGLNFSNRLTETADWNYFLYTNLYNGGGVASGDLDGDGLPEIFMVGNMSGSHLFHNRGKLKFEDITKKAGITSSKGWYTAVKFVDVNGDGLLDIYLCKAASAHFDAQNELWINKGHLTFEEQAAAFGLNDASSSTDAAFFDADNDGDLDVYIVNHPLNFNLPIEDRVINERQPNMEESDHLFLQGADGKFLNATDHSIGRNWAFGLSVSVADFNDDGWMDVFVGNDFSERDFYLVNKGDGRFEDNLFNSFNHISNFSMGSDAADFNNDGAIDLFVADMMASDSYRKKTNMSGMNPEVFWDNVQMGRHYQYMQNVLQLNNGNNSFSEIAGFSGTANTDWSWSTIFADFDNDGWKDLLVTNGMRRDVRNNDIAKKYIGLPIDYLREHYDSLLNLLPVNPLPNYVFRNNADYTFSSVAADWGVNYEGFSNGALAVDLDLDGDLDLVFNNLEDQATLYENQTKGNNYLEITFEGNQRNRKGVGARVYVTTGGETQLAELSSTRGFLSSPDPVLHFGLGTANRIDRIEVIWPGNKKQELQNVKANQRITLNEKEAQAYSRESVRNRFVRERSFQSGIPFLHEENAYDDFEKEVLLPYQFSQLGPALAKGDVNQDGLEDVFVGGAAGQSGAVFLQQKDGSFQRQTSAAFQQVAEREDIAATFFDADGDGDLDLYVGEGSNEWISNAPQYSDVLYENDGSGNFLRTDNRLPSLTMSTGVVAHADIDGDGDEDLFVGGRLVPAKYPFPANATILLNDEGTFKPMETSAFPALTELGMVTDACWHDLNGDQRPDLIVAAEWQPIRVFLNGETQFQEATKAYGLDAYVGWWYSLLVKDVNQDGVVDIVAGNLGENSRLHREGDLPLQVHAGDLDGNQAIDIVLSTSENGKVYPVRGRQCSSEQVPVIKDRFETYDSFASATIAEIYGEPLEQALHYEANWLQSTLFLGTSDGTFEARPLPAETQFSAVQSIGYADINDDGKEEIILVGNLYRTEVETPRLDASTGTILQWNNGGMETIPLSESGFFAYGDIKHMEIVQNATGNYLLILATNDGPVRVFQSGF